MAGRLPFDQQPAIKREHVLGVDFPKAAKSESPPGIESAPPGVRQLPSKRLQILDEVALLLRGETQTTNPVVMCHDIGEGRSTAVVEVRRVLPKCT
jgi:hypothetical protein